MVKRLGRRVSDGFGKGGGMWVSVWQSAIRMCKAGVLLSACESCARGHYHFFRVLWQESGSVRGHS